MWTGILAAIVALFKLLPKLIELYAEWNTKRQAANALRRKNAKDALVDSAIDGVSDNEGIQPQPTPDKPPGLP